MSLFGNLLILTIIYNLFFHSSVICRISDKRRCANADCSEPISFATTLLRYNADDSRLLSFHRNVKAKIFSKEAGSNPNFWEAEINGRRGYVPKGLLREDKVLIPTSKLKHVVPTEQNDKQKQNTSEKNIVHLTESPIHLTATPELPAVTSKGLFSMMSGVSADSVPLNSPDIKPQSSKKFHVFDGTTIYDESSNELVNEKHESLSQSPEKIKGTTESNVPSGNEENSVNEAHEETVLNELAQETVTEAEQLSLEELEITKSDNSNGFGGNTPEPSVTEPEVGTSIFNKIVNKVSNFISSGEGANKIDDSLTEVEGDEVKEYEEGSTEDYKDEEDEENAIADKTIIAEFKEIISDPQLLNSGEETEISLDVKENVTKTPDTISIFSESHSPEKTLSEDTSDQNKDLSENSESKNNTLDGEGVENSATIESVKDSNEVVSNVEEKNETEDHNLYNIVREEKDQDDEKFIANIGENKTVQSVGSAVDVEIKTTEEKTETTEAMDARLLNGDNTKINSESRDETETFKKEDYPSEKEETSREFETPSVLETTESSKPILNNTLEKDMDIELQVEPVHENPLTGENTGSREQIRIPYFMHDSAQVTEDSTENLINKTEEVTLEPELEEKSNLQAESLNDTDNKDNLSPPPDSYPSQSVLKPLESPKYSSIISKRFQGTNEHHEKPQESDIVEENETDNNEEASVDYNFASIPADVDLSSTLTSQGTIDSKIFLQSQSPKYSSVISKRIGAVSPIVDVDDEKFADEKSENIIKSISIEPLETSKEIHIKSKETSKEEIKSKEDSEVVYEEQIEPVEESIGVSNEVSQDILSPTSPDNIIPYSNVVEVTETELNTPEEDEGLFSSLLALFDLFGSTNNAKLESEDAVSQMLEKTENLDTSKPSHIAEETCSADGLGEGPCQMIKDAVQKDVSWQQSLYTSDMVWPWDFLDKVPLEATIWLIITAIVVLIFSLGHYYIEAHRRDGPLVAIINKLEREVLILKKESCILEDRLQIAQQQLEAWNTSSSENDALIVELKQELEETKAAKVELEEQTALLKEELEQVTESGLEMHRLLEESLSSQDGSQVLLSTVETLREKLQRQEEEITGLSQALTMKNAEVDELQEKLAQSAEVAHSLEDKIIAITREKDEEALQLRDKHRELIAQLEEVMETKALEETRVSTDMSRLRLQIEELQKTLAEKDSELETLKETVKQLRSTDSNEKIEALFDVVGIQAKLKTAIADRDDFREKFQEEEGARKLLEGHMKKITQEVAELKNNFETAEKEKIEALTKLQVLSNYFKEKESQLQKELGLQESMWLQKQSDDHTIYEQMRSLREENEKYKLQNESLKKEIVEQESSFKIQLANVEQKAHENWVTSRQAERRLKEVQQEAAQLRNRLTMVEKNAANYSLDDKQNISESNGDPSSPPPSLMFPPTTSPPFMMYPMPPPGDFVPPPPLVGSPFPSDSRPPPLGRISSPPLDPRFSPPPPLPYPPYDYPHYGHHSPSPPPPLPSHHRNVHKPQPRDMSREQKDHVPNYSPEAEKTTRRTKR